MRSKTKDLTGFLPYVLSMCPTTITALSEEREDLTTACLVMHANVAHQGTTVRVQTIYKKNDVVATGEKATVALKGHRQTPKFFS